MNTKDRAEQLRFVKARLEEAEKTESLAVEEASPPLLISDAWEAYVENPDRPDSGDETMRSYEGHWSKFTRWLGQKEPPPKYLRDITPQMAREYATHLKRGKVSPNTYNKYRSFLKALFHILVDDTRISVNPFDKISHRKLKTRARRELTLAELKAILESASGELQALLYIGTFMAG